MSREWTECPCRCPKKVQPFATVKVSKCAVHGRERWRLTWRAGARTVRRFFPTKEAATTYASVVRDEIASAGAAFSALPSAERATVIEAYQRAKDRGYTLLAACLAYEANGRRGESGIGLAELVARHLAASKAHMRHNSYQAKRRTLEAFAEAFAGRGAQSITAEDIRAHIGDRADWGPWRRRGWLVDVSALFNWGIREELLTRNPTRAVKRPNLSEGVPVILTAAECSRLLKASTRDVIAPLALAMFAGLRTAEIQRLDWSDIKWIQGVLEVPALKAKTRQRRLVPILSSLDKWLSPVVQKRGKIFKRRPWLQWKKTHKWKKNALRHSWISYRLGAVKDIAQVSLEAGNTPEVIFEHYRELVTEKEAMAFFSL